MMIRSSSSRISTVEPFFKERSFAMELGILTPRLLPHFCIVACINIVYTLFKQSSIPLFNSCQFVFFITFESVHHAHIDRIMRSDDTGHVSHPPRMPWLIRAMRAGQLLDPAHPVPRGSARWFFRGMIDTRSRKFLFLSCAGGVPPKGPYFQRTLSP